MNNNQLKGKSILIADDEDYVRQHLAKHLENLGLTIYQAGSGDEALILAENEPSLIILDVKMPNLDGIQTTRRLKENGKTRAIPVILLSAMVRNGEVSEGMAAGASGYLLKPITFARLLDSIKEYIG